jgi:hypothetical protein
MGSFEDQEIAPEQKVGANSDRKSQSTFASIRSKAERLRLSSPHPLRRSGDVYVDSPPLVLLDHAALRRNRLNEEKLIDSKKLEHAFHEKPASTFSPRALG